MLFDLFNYLETNIGWSWNAPKIDYKAKAARRKENKLARKYRRRNR